MLTRVLEPELMDTPEEAVEYDRIDHRAVNDRFVGDFLSALGAHPGPAHRPIVADIGAGTARVPIALCRAWRECAVLAIDLAPAMLHVGVSNVRAAQLETRVLCPLADARRLPFRDGSVPMVISNTLMHHIPDSIPVWKEMCRIAQPGALIFVRDLFRPETEGDVQRLVAAHAAYETSFQRELFAASLRAALTVDEVRAIVRELPLHAATVLASSDRHWTLTATRR